MSSTAIPGVFPPVFLDGMWLADGGTFQNLALGDPITRCKEEEGVEDKDIIVDVIMCTTAHRDIPTWEMEDTTWLNAF